MKRKSIRLFQALSKHIILRHKVRKILLIFCFIFLSSIVLSQLHYKYPVTNFTTKDYGIFQGQQNWAIVQDNDWNIYVGNDNGVLLYNGLNWKLIPVVLGQKVHALALDSQNRIFVGCSGGQFGYLEKNKFGRFSYFSLSEKLNENEKPLSPIWRVFVVNDKIYFQCNEAIYLYKNNVLETIYPENSFHLALCTGEEIYARDRNKGLVKITGNKVTLLNNDQRLKDFGVFALLKDDSASGSLLLITQELGLFRIDNNTGKLSELSTPDKETLISARIYGGIKLPGNLFALNTQLNGTIVINNQGKIIRSIDKEIGLLNNYVLNQYFDKAGNLWLAMDKGIAKVEWNSPVQLFDEQSGLSGNIYSSGFYGEDVFIGTSNGLFRKRNSDARFNQVGGVGAVWKLSEFKNSLLVAAENGLFKVENEKLTRVFDASCKALFYSENLNRLIIGTNKGIYALNDQFKLTTTITEEFGEIYEITEGKTEYDTQPYLWATTLSGNTIVISLKDSKAEIKNFSGESGLPHEWIYPFHYNGKIYFGTNYGLLELKGKSFDPKGIFDFALLSGKKTESSFSYFESVDQNEYYYVSENLVHHYKSNHLKKLQVVPATYGRINDIHYSASKLLISCNDGVVVYEERGSFSMAPLILRKIQVNNDSVLFEGGKSVGFKINEPLNFEFNNLQFFFSSGNFSEEEQNQYAVRLEGPDTMFYNWKKGNSVLFNHLKEGTYRLKLKYKNILGKESDELFVSFTILPPWYRTYVAYTLYAILFIIALLSSAKIASYRLKKQKIILEKIVELRTAEIAGKNEELAARNTEILHQKQEITDSINYAKRIQNAILPPIEEIQKSLSETFVLFLPKDIVSGDFYWYHKINDNQFLIACADCTGHGVPGGFMSMVCAEKLNEAANSLDSPSAILSWVNKAIKKSLKQDGNVSSTKDGMEISLIKVSLDEKKVVYSGANRFLWLIKKEEDTVTEYKPTKAGIAGTTENHQEFTEHVISVSENDLIYLSSDGFGDQFGGLKQKKLTTKKFKEILIKNKNLPMQNQYESLKDFITDWRGSLDQVDDILVIGLKF